MLLLKNLLDLSADYCQPTSFLISKNKGDWGMRATRPTTLSGSWHTILHFLAVAGRLSEFLDNQRSRRRDDVDLGDTILDGQLAGHFEALPILRRLCDVFTNFLGRLKR
jgi:hypothetical protein